MLLRLKRKYTKDEEVGLIIHALRDKDVEIGKLKSEIVELKHNIKELKASNEMAQVNRYRNQIEKQKKEITGLNARINLMLKNSQ